MTARLFNDEEIDAASDSIRVSKRDPWEHRRKQFSNSISQFLRYFIEVNDTSSPSRIFAIDTSELFPKSEDDGLPDKAFSFEPVTYDQMNADAGVLGKLSRLDELIRQKLLFSKNFQITLLDAHSEEITQHQERRKKRISKLTSAETVLSEETLNQIISLLEKKDTEVHDEALWGKLTEEFFPWLQDKSINSFKRDISQYSIITDFFENSNYCYLRAESVFKENDIPVDKTIENRIWGMGYEKFSFSKFLDYLERGDRPEEYNSLVSDLDRLFGISRFNQKGNKADARALAQAHYFNSFLSHSGVNVRLCIVSRSHAMHDVFASLPANRLNVTIIHPLFLPEVYGIEPKMQGKLTRIFRSARNLLSLPNRFATKQELISETQAEARQIIGYLSGLFSVGSEPTDVTSSSSSPKSKGVGGVEQLSDEVIEILRRNIRDGSDPLTRYTWGKTQSRIVDFLLTLGSKKSQKILVCFLEGENQAVNQEFAVVRFVEPYFGIAFHFYSKPMLKFLRSFVPKHDKEDAPSTYEIDMPLAEIVDEFTRGMGFGEQKGYAEGFFDAANEQNSGGLSHKLDLALFNCLVLCSRGYTQIAAEVLSSVLSPLYHLVRTNQDFAAFPSAKYTVFLALREVLFLRHHCERQAALLQALETDESQLNFVAERLEKNIARAQRDLDFSVLMWDNACQIHSSINSGVPDQIMSSSKGYGQTGSDLPLYQRSVKRDARNLITHIGGWLDQFLILLQDRFVVWPTSNSAPNFDSLEARSYVWIMCGLAKEAVDTAETCRSLSKLSSSPAEVVYFSHLEKRLLQSALMLFCAHFGACLVPIVSKLLEEPVQDVKRSLLVFSDWNDWWLRYCTIDDALSSQIRMNKIIDIVCKAVECVQGGHDPLYVRHDLRDDLFRLCEDHPDRSTMLLLAQLITRQLSE